MASPPHIAVVGGGWAGLAAAVHACQGGAKVSLLEMAPQWGGRARSIGEAGKSTADARLDNGQHILIGAYTETLALMRQVGADPDALLWRSPLQLRYPGHAGLQLPPGHALLAFARGVLAYRRWSWADRLACLGGAAGWLLRGFRCAPTATVQQLCADWPEAVREELIDPLCVAALNTPASQASAQVFLRVMRDALFAGPGSSDLLLPRRPLAELLPEPAATWLQGHGAELRLGQRVQSLSIGAGADGAWRIDDEAFDAVILACSAAEAARLVGPINPGWQARAVALQYEPIITVYLHVPGLRLASPMMALLEDETSPAQFAFDLGQLGLAPDRLAMVISGAASWLAQGLQASAEAAANQARKALGLAQVQIEKTLAEKRATFACTPGLQRPSASIAPGLWAAGDYVEGPYPATLEGAVRSGKQAAQQALQAWRLNAASS